MLVGHYCSYLMPKQEVGTFHMQVNLAQVFDHQSSCITRWQGGQRTLIWLFLVTVSPFSRSFGDVNQRSVMIEELLPMVSVQIRLHVVPLGLFAYF